MRDMKVLATELKKGMIVKSAGDYVLIIGEGENFKNKEITYDSLYLDPKTRKVTESISRKAFFRKTTMVKIYDK